MKIVSTAILERSIRSGADETPRRSALNLAPSFGSTIALIHSFSVLQKLPVFGRTRAADYVAADYNDNAADVKRYLQHDYDYESSRHHTDTQDALTLAPGVVDPFFPIFNYTGNLGERTNETASDEYDTAARIAAILDFMADFDFAPLWAGLQIELPGADPSWPRRFFSGVYGTNVFPEVFVYDAHGFSAYSNGSPSGGFAPVDIDPASVNAAIDAAGALRYDGEIYPLSGVGMQPVQRSTITRNLFDVASIGVRGALTLSGPNSQGGLIVGGRAQFKPLGRGTYVIVEHAAIINGLVGGGAYRKGTSGNLVPGAVVDVPLPSAAAPFITDVPGFGNAFVQELDVGILFNTTFEEYMALLPPGNYVVSGW